MTLTDHQKDYSSELLKMLVLPKTEHLWRLVLALLLPLLARKKRPKK